MGRPAYDVDLDAWKNRSAFHPADTKLKQLGHELARRAVVYLGELLHWLLPPSQEKSIAFQRLDEVRLYANMALAVNGGPALLLGDSVYTEDAVSAALQRYASVVLPSDPRIGEYEAQQRGELPGPAPDAPAQGMTGVVVQQAAEPGIAGEKPTAPDHEFEWADASATVKIVVHGYNGAVQLLLIDQETGTAVAKVVEAPFDLNQILSALAAAGDRVFTS